MKTYKYLWILVLALTFAACENEEENIPAVASLEIKDVTIQASYNEAEIQCSVNTNATIQEVVLEYATDTTFSGCGQAQMQKENPKSDKPVYAVQLTPLKENTAYFIRCRVVNKFGSLVSDPQTFKTPAYRLATVQTDSITDITVSSATLHATLIERGTSAIPEVGFCWAKHPEASISDSCIQCPLSTNKDNIAFSAQLQDLEDNTTYYIRAYAKNAVEGIAYGDEIFLTTTEIVLPTVGEVTVTDIAYTTATASGEVTDDGRAAVSERGVCYATTANPTVENTKVSDGKGIGAFTCSLTELQAGTTYYIRAYATNSKGTSYGPEGSFATNAYGQPIVETGEATNKTYTSATCSGNVIDDAGQEVTERGICYATTLDPTVESKKVVSGKGTGAFSCELNDLTAGTTYYFRAYAINSQGTAYGENESFDTKTYGEAIVATATVSSITCNSAVCGGTVTDDGGQTVTERGVCYSSTNETPTVEDTPVPSGNGTGAFTCDLTNLADNTTYYVRAYAINSKGTSYGDVVSFKTPEQPKAVIQSAIVQPAAGYFDGQFDYNCVITSNVNFIITEVKSSIDIVDASHSIQYNTTTSHSIKSVNGQAEGTISLNYASVLKDLPYEDRGDDLFTINATFVTTIGTCTATFSFTTDESGTYPSAFTVPEVTTTDVTSISYTSAYCGGNVTATGGKDITEQGICYATTPNPTTGNKKVVSSSTGLGIYSCEMTGLTGGVTYYVRAYAINSKGTGYGEQKTFTTTAHTKPTVVTFEASNVTYTTASCGGNVTGDGGLYITDKGICYSTHPSPTVNDMKKSCDSGMSGFSCTLTDLSEGTTYYFRAYATNSLGTEYGAEKSFTTLKHSVPTLTTTEASYVTYTSAVTGGKVLNTGDLEISERGICYATIPNPTTNDSKVTAPITSGSSGLGAFSCELNDLNDGTTYYVRAYAINSEGTGYGNQIEFTTSDKSAAIIYYTASQKLTETDQEFHGGFHSNAFGVTMVSHEFADGKGTITFSDALTTIGYQAFFYCSDMTSVTLPKNITTIGSYAFIGCSGLTSIELPNSVTSIGELAFQECSGLTSFTIPSKVVKICTATFRDCTGFKSFEIPNTIKTIEGYAFSGCTNLTSIVLPQDLKEINTGMFSSCHSLKSIDIPNTVTIIRPESFNYCESLTNLTIPNSVVTIDGYSFIGCTGLLTLYIGSGVTLIDNEAFKDCTSLTSVTCRADTPPTYSTYRDVFTNVGIASLPLYVPEGSVEAYKVANGWKQFKYVLPISE